MIIRQLIEGVVKTFIAKRLDKKFQAGCRQRHLTTMQLEDCVSRGRLGEFENAVARAKEAGCRGNFGE